MTSSMTPKSSNVGKAVATGGLLIAACAACCAPLIAAPVIALVAAGGAGFALVGQIGLGALVLAGIGVYVVAQRRRAAARKAASCGCAPAAAGSEPAAAINNPGLLERGRTFVRSIC